MGEEHVPRWGPDLRFMNPTRRHGGVAQVYQPQTCCPQGTTSRVLPLPRCPLTSHPLVAPRCKSTDCVGHILHSYTGYAYQNVMRCHANRSTLGLYASVSLGIGIGPPGESSFLAVNTSTPVSVTSTVCSTQVSAVSRATREVHPRTHQTAQSASRRPSHSSSRPANKPPSASRA